jgi:ubiquitin-protein ligase
MSNTCVELSKDCVKRLIKDIKDIKKSPLIDHGIYYIHSEDDILCAYALIIGPKNTPYENGYYLFDIKYPHNYPHSPPIFKFITNDGTTRFNPNLYTSGKVCLSILNTWSGEQWSACQSITSILLALCTIFNDKPLLNEPGIGILHHDFNNYNNIIFFKNYEFAICSILEKKVFGPNFTFFDNIIQEHFINNYDNNINSINEHIKQNYNNKIVNTTVYGMNIYLDFKSLIPRLKNIYDNLSKS